MCCCPLPFPQAAITVAGAFACYYVSEVILGVSGVLAIICAGAECAFFMWPLVCNRAALEHLWHFLEWLFNTALFELAGLIIGGRCLLRVELSWKPEWAGRDHDSGIDLADLALVGFTFVAAIAIRFIAVFSLLPLLRRLGYGFSPRTLVSLCLSFCIFICTQLNMGALPFP